MDDEAITRYLERIGVTQRPVPTTDALRELQAAHMAAIPFENLSIHLGETIDLADDAVLDKLIARRRGGFCYELNGGFALLLRALGYEVDLLAARVFSDGHFGPPLDHLALRVRTPEPWLVDVGFGAHSKYPLRLDTGEPQEDPWATFQIVPAPHGDVDVLKNGTPQYRLELRPRDLDEFAAMCWYQQHSPQSHFTRSLVCTVPTERGRVTISERLLIETIDGQRQETTLDRDDDVLRAYRERFGVDLATVPTLRRPA